jgi:hypothetical protein
MQKDFDYLNFINFVEEFEDQKDKHLHIFYTIQDEFRLMQKKD